MARHREARLGACGRKIEQWINRSKSVEMKRAAPAALSRERITFKGRRATIDCTATCRTWVPASRWKAPSEFPIHSILCFTTHPSAVAA
jgi:hypothetical protein